MTTQLPLHSWHATHGAKMVEFATFMMPVSYAGVLKEHQAVRQHCGLFDISHMGEFEIEGRDALKNIQYLTSNDAAILTDGSAQYSLLLNDHGGVIDDVIVYRIHRDRYFICVNASNISKDFDWIRSHLQGMVAFKNRSCELGMFALQGPRSAHVLLKLGFDLNSLARFCFVETLLAGCPVFISRTGYTGEGGCEMYVANAFLSTLWSKILEAGIEEEIQPIGLGARDTLRLEMGYSLYGHELTEQINPFEANLAWVVKMQKEIFLGRDALAKILAVGVSRKLHGLKMLEAGIPRQGNRVYVQDQLVGEVLSGTFSPSLSQGIATAMCDEKIRHDSEEIFVDIRGKMKKARVVQTPFIDRG